MNQLPAELRTPPLPVIALIGCPELHKDVGTYFNANLRPPLFFVSLPEANETVLARLFGNPKQPKPFRTPDGILKADWISKQRTRRASVAVTFVNRSDVEGDPSAWMRMAKGLQAVKAASAHRAVWRLLVVVQDGPVTELPQDRTTALWNNFDPKQLVVISRQLFDPALPPEQRSTLCDEQLRPLQQLVTEGAAAYYSAAAARLWQKQLDLGTSLGSCPPEISAAIAFKLAVFAEFQQDWPGAVNYYQAAAAALQGVPLGRPTVSCQRHAEVAAVAEWVHFKAMMLLLHQQRYAEAVRQLGSHLAAFGRVPEGLPLAAAASHYGWLARQYQCAAEMITSSRIDSATLQAHPEVSPCHLLMSAAQVALTRKTLVEQLTALSAGPPAFETSSVKKGRFLGQFERKQPEGPTHSSDLTDAECVLLLEAEELRVNHCQHVLDLLLQAQAAHLKRQQLPQQQPQQGPPAGALGSISRPFSRGAADRVSARLAQLIAEQQVETHNLTAARKLLLQVVYTYRRDGWDALLLHSLLLLRDVCQRLKLHKESLLHTLEVATLSDGLRGSTAADTGAEPSMFDHEQAQGLASAALLGLLAGPQDNKSSLKKHTAQPQQQQQQQQGEQLDQQVPGQQQQMQQQQQHAGEQGAGQVSRGDSPRSSSGSWEYCVQQLDLAAALQQLPPAQGDGAASKALNVADILLLHRQQDFGWWRLVTVAGGFVTHTSDPAQLCLCVALRNNMPVPLPLEAAAVTLSDAQGSWQQALRPGVPETQANTSSNKGSSRGSSTGSAGQDAAAGVAASLGQLQLQDQQQQQWPLQLRPGVWQQLHAVFVPRCIGSVGCEQLELRLSPQATVVYRIQTFPPGRPALGSSVLGPASPFGAQLQVQLGTWGAKVQHVGRLPQLQILRPELQLVGEFVPIDVRVAASAAQPTATLELSVRTAAGMPPATLTLLASLPDGKLHELSPQSQVLPLPQLSAGAVWTQRLWARNRDAGVCRLTATLSCPALVLQHAELNFRQPFEHRVRLSAEAGVHVLSGPSAAFAACNGSSADGDAGFRAGSTGAGTGAAVGSGQGLGASGSHSAADTGAGGALGAPAVPLVVGQSLLAQVLVSSSHAADLLLLNAALELSPGSQLKLLNNLSQQLAAAPLAASRGSVHCLLLQLLPTAKAQEPASMGRLRLSWRRKQQAEPSYGSSSGGGGSSTGPNASAVQTAAVTAATAAEAATAADTGPVPACDVETWLDLPQVVVQDSLMSVKASGPQNVTAGTSFPFTLQVHNLSTQPQEVQVLVQEAQGFVFAGSKQQSVNVLPRTIHTITWTLVAHASGQLQLPGVRVSCIKLNCSTLTQGASVHVMPY